MKTQASIMFALAACAGLVKAGGWERESSGLNYNALCGANPSTKVKHVCFAASGTDVTGITINTSFHGFYTSDKHHFVMYQQSGESTGMYQSLSYIINVQYTAKVNNQNCAAYDVQDVNGKKLVNGIYCPGQAAISLA